MADLPPPLPGCRRLCLYERPGEGLVNGRGEPLAGCGAARVMFLFRRGRCRRLLLSPVAVGGAFAGSASLRAYAAAYFHLAPDFAGAYLPAAAFAGWLARFTLDVPAEMPSGLLPFLSARCGEGFP
ncbi:hypothetical protein [Azospira oryzae]|jgi:hypothetical protein|uniref:hypothetical protein n=1 Tax=Azospira oryzae TaxID=146939 RepID=UPI0019659B72|nr:hypothetical protein [Azospira oryzae]